jgi:aminomethyltransferase
MNTKEGYRALRTGAAWLDLSARGKIRVTGDDRVRFLHAMSTNHIKELSPGDTRYLFFLSAQGRIQADACLVTFPDSFLLDTEPENRERVVQHLRKYVIADDVTLEDITEEMATVGVEGPDAPSLQAEFAGFPFSTTGAPGFRLYLPAGEKDALIGRLESRGVRAAAPDDARIVRLEHAKPRYGEDITDTSLPQETRQMQAVHFNKGCYLGQEIVERVRSRGHVNRLLMGIEIEGTVPPVPGAKLMRSGQEVGEITSAAFSPALGKVVGLANVRAQHAQPGIELQAGEDLATVKG